MTTPILHHYPSSPFAEKGRLMLGFKGLAWQSVHIPMVMPKPDVVALTGGYRRTPLLQVGADIYCDTSLIATVLEHLKPEPMLFPEHLKGIARIVAQWADGDLFWAAMGYTLSPKGAAAMFANQPPEAAQAFAADRGAMSAGMTRLRPGDATSAYRSHLRRLAHMLHEQPFLLGDAPCIADFAAYHEDVEKTLGRPVMTHEFADPFVVDEIKQAYRDEFLSLASLSSALGSSNPPGEDSA